MIVQVLVSKMSCSQDHSAKANIRTDVDATSDNHELPVSPPRKSYAETMLIFLADTGMAEVRSNRLRSYGMMEALGGTRGPGIP